MAWRNFILRSEGGLIVPGEIETRLHRLRAVMKARGIDGLLATYPVNLYYLTGQLADGFFYLPPEGQALYAVRRPVGLAGNALVRIEYIKSPAQLPEVLSKCGIETPRTLAMEEDELPQAEYARLRSYFGAAEAASASALLREARMVKSAHEIELLRAGAELQKAVHRRIPALYRDGMTDWALAAAVEYEARIKGHLGIMRCAGIRMEGYFTSVLSGENALAPSPYDFSLGGAGVHPSAPIGPTGETLRPGRTVAVDFAGNVNGYHSDMTRTYAVGHVPEEIKPYHQMSRDILRALEDMAVPGARCGELYVHAMEMVEKAGMAACFMGHAQQARFVGHGVGLQINERPVLTKKDHTPLEAGMVIAIEPKFTVPGVGHAGVENTYVVTETGLVCLTDGPEEIVALG